MNVTVFGLTDKGMVRAGNEDSLLIDEQLGLFVVADGMGGHQAGEIASRMAVDIVREHVAKHAGPGEPLIGEVDSDVSLQAGLLASAIQRANLAILEAGDANPDCHGMGSTIVALLAREGGVAVAHAGDSRLYLLRDGLLRQVTGDHSLVAEQVRRGIITEEEAAASRRKNIITRALGQWEELEVELQDLDLEDGDRLLLCSDGLSGMVSDSEISALLESHPVPEQACRELIDAANRNGGKDNVTAVLLAFQQEKGFVAGLMRLFQ